MFTHAAYKEAITVAARRTGQILNQALCCIHICGELDA
jgi:hypothetical protein